MVPFAVRDLGYAEVLPGADWLDDVPAPVW